MSAAVVVRSYGGPEVLTVEQVDVPPPAPGQVTVQVAAAGVNFIDIYRRTGVYAEPLPNVAGREGSGTVVAVGEGVADLAVGDRVAWSDVAGSYAQIVDAPADKLVPVPDGVTDEQAAAFPLQGLTAHYLATGSYRIQPGDTVLVHAGAGGVGLLLTQIGILGAKVITTVSSEEKAALSQAAGAWQVLVGYDNFAARVKDLTDGDGVQAVYDGVGKDTFDGSLASLAVRGTLVLFGGASGQVPPFDLQRLNSGGSLSVTRPTLLHFTRTRSELLERAADVLGWIASGQLSLLIGGTYPLAEAGRAHNDLEGRRSTGKLLLLP